MAEIVSGGGALSASPSTVRPDTGARGVQAQAKTVLLGASARFLGPGVVQLLHEVEASGSVKKACAAMQLSYTKGWRLIHTLEAELGFVCVTRQQGGVGGGGAGLTPECRALLVRFELFSREVDAAVEALFDRHFPDL